MVWSTSSCCETTCSLICFCACLRLCVRVCVWCDREEAHEDRMCGDCGHGWGHSSSVRVCVPVSFFLFFFATGKTQIIAHEMLFIQTSSSVTIPAQQHSTPHWRNTTEQISVKITVWRISPASPSVFTFFIFSKYFSRFYVSPPSLEFLISDSEQKKKKESMRFVQKQQLYEQASEVVADNKAGRTKIGKRKEKKKIPNRKHWRCWNGFWETQNCKTKTSLSPQPKATFRIQDNN